MKKLNYLFSLGTIGLTILIFSLMFFGALGYAKEIDDAFKLINAGGPFSYVGSYSATWFFLYLFVGLIGLAYLIFKFIKVFKADVGEVFYKKIIIQNNIFLLGFNFLFSFVFMILISTFNNKYNLNVDIGLHIAAFIFALLGIAFAICSLLLPTQKIKIILIFLELIILIISSSLLLSIGLRPVENSIHSFIIILVILNLGLLIFETFDFSKFIDKLKN